MYYLLFVFCYLISLLPLWLLYGLSDGLCFLLFRIFGYRKKIVSKNLSLAFPEKKEKEIDAVMRQFYHSFCDQWIESLKLISLPKKKINRRMSGNWEAFEQAINIGNGKVIVLLGHQFNWEWGHLATPLNFSGQYAGIYLPIKAKAVDRLFLYIRKRTNALLIPANDLRNGFRALEGKKYLLAFIADQNPATERSSYWTTFMNRPAPFLNGPEKVARRQEAAVVWVGIKKIKRGHYELKAKLLCDNANLLPEGALIELYVRQLEKELKEQPATWMWTHRRWKRKPPQNRK